MRKRFSERNGFVEVGDTFQVESINKSLMNRLLNKFKEFYIDSISTEIVNLQFIYAIELDKDKDFFFKIYDECLKIRETPPILSKYEIFREIESYFLKMQWYEIYDFLEYISQTYHKKEINIKFRKSVNLVLEAEMSAYRFIDNHISAIIDNIEIQSIEKVLESEYSAVKQHLSNAIELLEIANYQNSIKESITAVESVAKIITGKEADLASCIKVMDIDLNKQFKTSMINLYGWTCKEDGIRHGHTKEELKTSFEEAKYMLVSCSAFVNYLIAKNKD